MGRKKIGKAVGSFSFKQWLALAALVTMLGFTGYFVFRVVRFTTYYDRSSEEQIRGWMRVEHIARSHGVPPEVLYEALGLPAGSRDPRPLGEIARATGRSLEEVEVTLTAAIADYRAEHESVPEGRP